MPRRNNFPGNTGITSEARRVQSGLTLLEMVLVVAILAVLAALGFSWAGTAIKGIQIQLAARSLFSAVVQTRNEAVVRNMRVVLCKSPTGQTCSLAGGWEQGWIIFGDTNNNASRDGTETIFFVQKRLSGSVGITGKAPVSNYVSYTGTGSSKYPSGGFQSGTITLCDKSDGAVQPRTIVITSTGKPHTEKATAADCI